MSCRRIGHKEAQKAQKLAEILLCFLCFLWLKDFCGKALDRAGSYERAIIRENEHL